MTAIRRRVGTERVPEVIEAGGIVLDSGRRTVKARDQHLEMTATEFGLLRALMERKGRAVSRDDLISIVRSGDVAVMDRTVDAHVMTIRRKLGGLADRIETVRGVGYRMRD